jgi:predicted DCC family thiol-disulfide oxidoreductase YuxK
MTRATVIYDSGCRFCNRSKRLGERLDWLGVFQWTPSQQSMGAIVLRMGGVEYRGWRAVKRMAAGTPLTYMVTAALCGLLAWTGVPLPWAISIPVVGLVALLSPLSNLLGDPAYAWVARNRLRIMGAEQCEWKPPAQ